MAFKTYTVTVATGSRYGGGTGNVFYLDGVRTMDVDVVGGLTYAFNQDDATNDNHPLIFSTTTSTGQAITSGVTFKLDGSTVSYAQYTDTTTFNAATTRSVEIAVSQSADFYFICYVHGSGMGGVMDLQVDSWGALNWGDGQWNDQDNANAPVTGQAMTIAQGDETATGIVAIGWGREDWGDQVWGEPNEAPLLTGIAMSANIGSITITSEIKTGWGRDNWNTETWGDNTFIQNVSVTGIGMTATLGDETATAEVNAGWGRATWGNQVWGDTDEAATLTGIAMSATLGTVTATAVVNTGWGRASWSNGPWNDNAFVPVADLTGIQMTAAIGTVTATGVINSGWGRAAWGDQVWGLPSNIASPTGIQMSATLANVTITNEVNVGWGRAAWGQQPWGENTTFVQASVTGIGMTATIGSVSIGTEINSGWGRYAWGEGDWGTPNNTIAVSGQAMTSVLGQVDPAPDVMLTGIGMTMNEGEEAISGDGIVIPTGIGLTAATGSVYNLIWNEVNTGTTPTWKEVDTAA